MDLSLTERLILSKNTNADYKLNLRHIPLCNKRAWLKIHNVWRNENESSFSGISFIEDECLGMIVCALLENSGIKVCSTPISNEPFINLLHPLLSGHADGLLPEGTPDDENKPHIVCVNMDPNAAQILLYLYKRDYPQTFTLYEDILLVSFLPHQDFHMRKLHYKEQEASRQYHSLLSHIYSDYPAYAEWHADCASCPFSGFCQTNLSNNIACTTCAFFNIAEDGTFFCDISKNILSWDIASKAYTCHCWHPALVPWLWIKDKSSSGLLCYQDISTGKYVFNGATGVKSANVAMMLKVADTFQGEIGYGN